MMKGIKKKVCVSMKVTERKGKSTSRQHKQRKQGAVDLKE